MTERRSHVATFYVRLRADRARWTDNILGIKGTQLYQNPCGHDADETVVRVRLRVPDDAFEPFVTAELDVELQDAEVEASAVPAT